LSSYFGSTNETLFQPLAGKLRNTAAKFTPAVLKNEWTRMRKA